MEYAVALLVAAVIAIIYLDRRSGQRKHQNPADKSLVDFADLRGLCRLEDGGVYAVFTFRQSGNEHQERRGYHTIDEAVSAGAATLRRTGVPYVKISQNTHERFEFGRPYNDGRGCQEGKKVRWIEIVRVPAN